MTDQWPGHSDLRLSLRGREGPGRQPAGGQDRAPSGTLANVDIERRTFDIGIYYDIEIETLDIER